MADPKPPEPSIPYWLVPFRHRLWLQHVLARGAKLASHPGRAAWDDLVTALRGWPGTPYARGDSGRPAGGPLRLAILMTPCCWDDFVIPVVQLGRALERHGMAVAFWGGAAGPCAFWGTASLGEEPWTDAHCRRRFDVLNERVLARPGAFRPLNDRVSEDVRRRAAQWMDERLDIPILELERDGLAAWDCVAPSSALVAGEPIVLAPGATARQRPGLRPLLEGFAINCEVIAAWLAEARPDALLVFGGYHYQERVAAELARRAGVRVVAHENSCFANRRIFDVTGAIGNRTSVKAATWPAARDRELSPAQEARLDAFLSEIWSGRINKIGQGGAATTEAALAGLGLDPARPRALLIGQVPIDTVMIGDLRAFPTSLAMIQRVIEIFAAMPEWDLIVRFHPLEADKFGDRTWAVLSQRPLPPNVRLVHARQANTYALMDASAFGITATSQAGLEMLAKGKPLVTIGDAYYAGKGFTLDAPDADVLEPVLRRAAASPVLTDVQRALVRKFLFHVIFEHQVPYDPVNRLFPPESVDRVEAMLRRGEPVQMDEDAPRAARGGQP